MEVYRNELALQESKGTYWHCKAMCGNSKEWTGTERQCMAIQRNGLALKGSAWEFQGMAWNCKEVIVRNLFESFTQQILKGH